MIVFIIVLILLFYIFVLKPYIKPQDTVELWVGTNGSGKSLNAVKSALKRLKKNTIKIRFHNLLHPFNKKPLPVIISNLPIQKNGKIISYELTSDLMLGVTRLPEKCVVLIDEVSLWLSQMDFKNKNVDIADDMATLFRHYTKGGSLILVTQDISKCAFPYRYCTGSAFVLSDFKKHWWSFGLIGSSSVRRISINGDIQAIEINQKEENEDRIYCVLSKHYDTYAYSDRYSQVPFCELQKHTALKVNKVLRCPKDRVTTFIQAE